jgi:hypothetical protein
MYTVDDLAFYRSFFGSEPTKVKDNYAKFEIDDPALHFSLNVRPFEKKGVLNHLGFQVDNTEEVLAMGERLRQWPQNGLRSKETIKYICLQCSAEKRFH